VCDSVFGEDWEVEGGAEWGGGAVGLGLVMGVVVFFFFVYFFFPSAGKGRIGELFQGCFGVMFHHWVEGATVGHCTCSG